MKHRFKWTASIHVDGRHIHLGYFDDEIAAAYAYDAAAIRYQGEFASPNFINGRANPRLFIRHESLQLKPSQQARRGKYPAQHPVLRTGRLYRGVYKRSNRFRAAIRDAGKSRQLGTFLTALDAARAYDAAAKKCFGLAAILNFPETAPCQNAQPPVESAK